ncbi:hypothetical protein G6M12_24755 [Agrobacterium tumefaciens]|nr:hypothetical protein [Agrobacterium tumefaciens]
MLTFDSLITDFLPEWHIYRDDTQNPFFGKDLMVNGWLMQSARNLVELTFFVCISMPYNNSQHDGSCFVLL